MTNPIAALDRRVSVIEGLGVRPSSMHRVSDLRASSFVVLLGEPGIGKSTVLELEAANDNASVMTVRDLMTGALTVRASPLYLDALDEYRIDGSPADKVHSLGQLISRACPSRWRLTCRSEDWRKEADIAAIRRATSGESIVVAQLLPLVYDESARVLQVLGERDPDRFLAKAYSLGAQALLESPLSLKLLYAAVRETGEWPRYRYELFDLAILKLAHEHNPERKWGQRCPVPQIIEAAETACLVLLASGRRTIWQSHGEPPAAGGDKRAFLRAYDLGQGNVLVRDMLDSSLFRGEGESFEPMHRTVAEYLAGRALARAVVGGPDRAAFPLGRAIAMVTGGVDRMAPTEMRGLYAWFAAHLAKLGHEHGARQLIEADASTVLAYGDAAVFPTSLRRLIFNNLDKVDPYFRSGEHRHDTAVGGLSGPDLIDDFAQILDNSADGTHRLLTVFDVLTIGPPIEALRPRLWMIALDPIRPEWQRRRAADAWLNGAQGRARELFHALNAAPASADREVLRIHLASLLPPETLNINDIKTLIADFEKTPNNNTVGRLIGLTANISTIPRGALFDAHLDTWLPKDGERNHGIELDSFFDGMLAAAIRGTRELTPSQVWRWTCNVRNGRWDNLHEASGKALRNWLDAESGREAALFDLIIADEDARDAPWIPRNDFIVLTGRSPSASVIRHILARAAQTAVRTESKALLAVAVETARHVPNEHAYQETLESIAERSDCTDLVQRLVSVRDDARIESRLQTQETRRRKRAKQKKKNIEILTPEIDELRVGLHPGHLAWAAKQYLAPQGDDDLPGGLERVVYFADETIAEAVQAGWRYIATQDFVGVDARMLGEAVGKNETYHLEWAALAGLDQLLADESVPPLVTTPLVVAIAILKSSWMLHEASKRDRFESWAFNRLNVDPVAGAAQLLQFWTAAIDAGAAHIESFSRLSRSEFAGRSVTEALSSLLETKRAMPANLLRAALRAAAKLLDRKRLLSLAELALANPGICGELRNTWTFTAFTLDPRAHGARLLSEHGSSGGAQLYNELRAHEIEPVETTDPGDFVEREAVIVRLLGPSRPPDDDDTAWRGERVSNSAYSVRLAIQALANKADASAGRTIGSLIQDPKLAAWKHSLEHARAQWARLHRESAFQYPTPAAIRAVLAGGPPVNAGDLLAVVMEEIHGLREELRFSDSTPWKHYWNRGSDGEVLDPLIENQCRDQILLRLRDRLRIYQVTAALPEARRSEETRADMLILSGAGKSLPIEVKRHFHRELWTAPATQLQGYAETEGSDRYGIYLVFWFGLDKGRKIPGRADGASLPTSATELETMLANDLTPEAQERIRVVVFDVSKEAAGTHHTIGVH